MLEDLLHRAQQAAALLYGEEPITPRQYALLRAAREHDGANQTALVKASGIDRSTITDVVRRLVDAGLLERRRPKNDNRSYAVKPTAAGLAILKAAEARVRDADRQLLSGLPRGDRKRFLEMLKAIGRETP
jgi:DNA-binding MarR family transcriptional regulator